MGREEMVDLLLKNGANFEQKDSRGNRPIHYTASRCLPRIMKKLVDAGASVSVQNDEYNNPLHLVAMNQRPDSNEWENLLIELIRCGCDLKQENASNKIPEAYVGRSLKHLFSLEEVKRRDAEKHKEQQRIAEIRKSEDELKNQFIAEKRMLITAREQRLKDEEERKHREAEDRHRAEDDARWRVEELLEQKRLEEEEARRAKAKAAKGK
jgi:hypothetical protein